MSFCESSETNGAILRLSERDNVAIARRPLAPGSTYSFAGSSVTTLSPIPAGHKVAVLPIPAGAPVLRYGQIIGFATNDIARGDHVHVHNVTMRSFEREPAYCQDARPTDFITPAATFLGIPRPGGRFATRNYIGILTSVNCSATVAQLVADAFLGRQGMRDPTLERFPNVDGVVALTHRTGCGMAHDGEGLAILRRTLAGFARHVNFSHVLFLGLGCEVNQIDALIEEERLSRGRDTIPTLNIQTTGGTRKTVERAVAMIREILPDANRATRVPAPLSELIVGLQCGGSDGYSGITANPALGVASDLVVRNGGSVILAETPEAFGAEHLLTRRAENRSVGEKLMSLMKWWEDYAARHGGTMDNNPSPGNKAGGITTILEKSLGAVAKAGSTNLVDVLRYAEPLKKRGFNYMDSPGYDPVSVTGEIASGANLVCFTTGRGSVFGCVPAPCIKLSTNRALFERMSEDMDLDCGGILEGEESVEECGRRVFDHIVRVASGEKTKSELLGFGAAEFAPWPLGAVM